MLKDVLTEGRYDEVFPNMEEEGDRISRIVTAFSKVGINIKNPDGTFKSSNEIVWELTLKWSELNVEEVTEICDSFDGITEEERQVLQNKSK